MLISCLHHDATCKINCALHHVKFLKKFYKHSDDAMNYEDFQTVSYFEYTSFLFNVRYRFQFMKKLIIVI